MFTKEFDIAMQMNPMKNDRGGAKITGTYKGPTLH